MVGRFWGSCGQGRRKLDQTGLASRSGGPRGSWQRREPYRSTRWAETKAPAWSCLRLLLPSRGILASHSCFSGIRPASGRISTSIRSSSNDRASSIQARGRDAGQAEPGPAPRARLQHVAFARGRAQARGRLHGVGVRGQDRGAPARHRGLLGVPHHDDADVQGQHQRTPEGRHARRRDRDGGAPVTQEYADAVGADGYAADASGCVRKAKDLLKTKRAKVLA